MSKVEEYKRKLEEYEKKIEEEAKLFNIDEFLADSEALKEKYVEGLGIIKYKRLNFGEMASLSEKYGNDRVEFSCQVVAKMLSKADPNVTVEKFKMLPPDVAVKIINALIPELGAGFLQATEKY